MKLHKETIEKYAEKIGEVLKERDNGFGLRASQIAEDCELKPQLIGRVCGSSSRFVSVGGSLRPKYMLRQRAEQIGVVEK